MAIDTCCVRVGEIIDGQEVVKIEARIIAPDLYEVTYETQPYDAVRRLIEKASTSVNVGSQF